jgi:hypothetical protein
MHRLMQCQGTGLWALSQPPSKARAGVVQGRVDERVGPFVWNAVPSRMALSAGPGGFYELRTFPRVGFAFGGQRAKFEVSFL